MTRGLIPLALTLLSLGACGPESDAPDAASEVGPLIDVRLAPAEPRSGLESVEFEGRTLHLEAASVLTDSDLRQVEPSVGDSTLLLHLELRPESADRMRARIEDEVGGHLAIFVDGRLRVAPEIVSASGGTRVSMGFPATEEEALRVADLIRSRWPSAEDVAGVTSAVLVHVAEAHDQILGVLDTTWVVDHGRLEFGATKTQQEELEIHVSRHGDSLVALLPDRIGWDVQQFVVLSRPAFDPSGLRAAVGVELSCTPLYNVFCGHNDLFILQYRDSNWVVTDVQRRWVS